MKNDIPLDVRRAVDDRDLRFCRVCGTFAGVARELHHVIYGGSVRGMGGRRVHNVDEIVTLCGICHHTRVHRDKKRWDDLLLDVIRDWPGFTAIQVERWRKTGRG